MAHQDGWYARQGMHHHGDQGMVHHNSEMQGRAGGMMQQHHNNNMPAYPPISYGSQHQQQPHQMSYPCTVPSHMHHESDIMHRQHQHSEGMMRHQQQNQPGFCSQYNMGDVGDYGDHHHPPRDGPFSTNPFYHPQQHQQGAMLQQPYESSAVYGGMDPSMQEQQQSMMQHPHHFQNGVHREPDVACAAPESSYRQQRHLQLHDRRDSLPFQFTHLSQGPTQATPVQQQPLYNGPPVSALVPRGTTTREESKSSWLLPSSGSFTPATVSSEPDRAFAFLSSRKTDSDSKMFETAAKSIDSSVRHRTSMGFSVLSHSPEFFVPTPSAQPQAGSSPQSLSTDADSPPMIPPPPIGAVMPPREESPPKSDYSALPKQLSKATETCEERGPLCVTSKSNHIVVAPNQDANVSPSINLPSETIESSKKTHESMVHLDMLQYDASLLMGLRTGESASKRQRESPIVKEDHRRPFPSQKGRSTTKSDSPKLKDPPDLAQASSMDTAETFATATTADTDDSKALPKTCFPAAYPNNYPKRLTTSSDESKLNLLHCFIRSELLEVFVVEKANDDIKFRHAPSSSVGRVGLRCVHCALRRNRGFEECPDDEAPMSVFYPKAIKEIYRLVTSWQRCHLRKCRNLPPTVRHRWDELRTSDKSRGKTGYWTESALMIGLRDCPSRAGGMRFDVACVEAQQQEAAAVEDTEETTTATIKTESMDVASDATERVDAKAVVSTISDDCTMEKNETNASAEGSDVAGKGAVKVKQEETESPQSCKSAD